MSEFWAYEGGDVLCIAMLSVLCVLCLTSARLFVRKL